MGVYRAVISGLVNGQLCQNVLHFQKGGAWTPDLAASLCIDLRDNMLQQWKLRLSNTMQWNGISVYDAETPGRQPSVLAISVPGSVGTSSGNNLPFACTLLRIRTAVTGPRGRGRVYLPGAPNVDFVGGLATANTSTSWAAIFAVIGPRYVGITHTSPFEWVLAPKASPADWKSITSLELSGPMGVQRRRNIGVGV